MSICVRKLNQCGRAYTCLQCLRYCFAQETLTSWDVTSLPRSPLLPGVAALWRRRWVMPVGDDHLWLHPSSWNMPLHRRQPSPYGERRSSTQPPSGRRRERRRSCKRLGHPCQNSIDMGLRRYPPQYGGRATSRWACSAISCWNRSARICRWLITWPC